LGRNVAYVIAEQLCMVSSHTIESAATPNKTYASSANQNPNGFSDLSMNPPCQEVGLPA
jgi:hypothetical protein